VATDWTKEQRAVLKMLDKAIRAAGRKLSFRSGKSRNTILEYAAEDRAEAYQIGAEEAQGEILDRLHEIRNALAPSSPAPIGHLEKQRDADTAIAERMSERRT
jgi:hypothetical protein